MAMGVFLGRPLGLPVDGGSATGRPGFPAAGFLLGLPLGLPVDWDSVMGTGIPPAGPLFGPPLGGGGATGTGVPALVLPLGHPLVRGGMIGPRVPAAGPVLPLGLPLGLPLSGGSTTGSVVVPAANRQTTSCWLPPWSIPRGEGLGPSLPNCRQLAGLRHTTTAPSHAVVIEVSSWWSAVGGWLWLVVKVMESSLSAWTEPPVLSSRRRSPAEPPLRQASETAVCVERLLLGTSSAWGQLLLQWKHSFLGGPPGGGGGSSH